MNTVQELLQQKGSQVWTIHPEATVLDAALLMNDHKIGSLIVTDDEKVVGMFTERDILQRVVAEELLPAHTTVGDVMSTGIACCTPSTRLDEARTSMKNRRIRHLPVISNQGKLLGMISIGDLNAQARAETELSIFLLEKYLYERT